jgi:tetratricopeptide (TPR) repeat protein
MGDALRDLGRPEEALAVYQGAIELEPDNDRLWKIKGNAFCRLDRYEEAVGAVACAEA